MASSLHSCASACNLVYKPPPYKPHLCILRFPNVSFCSYWQLLNKTQFLGLRDGSAIKSIACSSRGCKFDSQHPHQVIQNYLWFKIQGNLTPLTSTGTSTCMHISTHRHRKIIKHKIKISKLDFLLNSQSLGIGSQQCTTGLGFIKSSVSCCQQLSLLEE